MIRWGSALVVAVASVLLVADAHGGCGVHRHAYDVAPPSGTVPEQPRLLLLGQDKSAISVRAVDGALRSLPVEVRDFGKGEVPAVEILVGAPKGRLSLHVTVGEKTRTFSYKVKRRKKRKKTSPTKLKEAQYEFSVGDPGAQLFVLGFSPAAPAYLVTTAEGTSFVVPNQAGLRGRKRSSKGLLAMGRPGCPDASVVPTEAPLAAEVTPLFPDGRRGEPYRFTCVGTRCANHRQAVFGGKVRLSPLR